MYAGTKKSISTKQSNNNGQTAKFSQNHNQKKVAETNNALSRRSAQLILFW